MAAVQTSSIPSPVAAGATPSFSTLSSATGFPLFQTSIDGSFGGDATTTNAGAVLTVSPGNPSRLTINNSSLNVSNVPVTGFPGADAPGSFDVITDISSGNLDYTRFGYWIRYQATEGMFQSSAFTAGFVTPSSAIPTVGTATYSGTASGIYNDQAPCNCSNAFVSNFTGDVSVTANFGGSSLNGSIRNIVLKEFVPGLTPGAMNDIAFNATIDRTANLFTGTTSVSATPGGAWAFSSAATGRIDGRFYGPTAQEIGAVFQLTEGVKRLIGSFGVKGH